jgi:hypothetical protein
MRGPESILQEHCVNWFRLQYPRLRTNLFAIPNGGYRHPSTGAILKREGAVPGVADLFLAYPSQTTHGLFIEMKTPTGRQQPSQKDFEVAILKAGYSYILARTVDQFIAEVTDYLKGADL